MRDMFDILGEQVVSEMATPPSHTVGFDWGALISSAANVTKTAVEQKQSADAANKAKTDTAAAAAKAIAADAQWQNNEANLELVATDPVASTAARIQRDSAKAAALAAGAGLTGEALTKRCKAAQDALQAAAAAAVAEPKNAAKRAKFNAWKTVADACGSPPTAEIVKKDDRTPEEVAGPWITRKSAGLPHWGWLSVGVGGLGALFLIIRAMRKK